MTTYPEVALTAHQAAVLNRLAASCLALRSAAKELAARASDIHDRAKAGHHLSGFDSDPLGQCGREVAHHASQRAAYLVDAMGTPDTALMASLTAEGSAGLSRRFSEGDEFSTEPVTL